MLALGAGVTGWYVFHNAGLGDPCLDGTPSRSCDSDAYCVDPSGYGKHTCMTERQGKAACKRGPLCKERGLCDLNSTGCSR